MPTSKYRGEAEELLLCGILMIPDVLIPVQSWVHPLSLPGGAHTALHS